MSPDLLAKLRAETLPVFLAAERQCWPWIALCLQLDQTCSTKTACVEVIKWRNQSCIAYVGFGERESGGLQSCPCLVVAEAVLSRA